MSGERTSSLSDGEVERTAGFCGNTEVDGRVGAALVFIYRLNHLHHLKSKWRKTEKSGFFFFLPLNSKDLQSNVTPLVLFSQLGVGFKPASTRTLKTTASSVSR